MVTGQEQKDSRILANKLEPHTRMGSRSYVNKQRMTNFNKSDNRSDKHILVI